MNQKLYSKHIVSPTTGKPLEFNKSFCGNDGEKYDIIKGVPILLPENQKADWHRELIEAVLWEHPDRITEMYTKIDWSKSPVPVYLDYIRKYVGSKAEVENALLRYVQANTEKWIVNEGAYPTVTKEQIKNFNRYSSRSKGRYRVKTVKKSKHPYNPYVKKVLENAPSTILELSTGAGSGTCAVAKQKDKDTVMFTVDIGFDCHGNVVGIGKYLRCRKTLLPVVANFWYLPFGDNTFDCVCSNCGLDESRENGKTISETARVLKLGGRFVNVSRKNAFMRQFAVLEPLGFSREEITVLMKKCRLYADTETLVEICAQNGLCCIGEEDFVTSETTVHTVSVFEKIK